LRLRLRRGVRAQWHAPGDASPSRFGQGAVRTGAGPRRRGEDQERERVDLGHMSVTTLTGAIVFTDIVGFTQLTDEHGDDLALTLLERQEVIVRAALPDSARVV